MINYSEKKTLQVIRNMMKQTEAYSVQESERITREKQEELYRFIYEKESIKEAA